MLLIETVSIQRALCLTVNLLTALLDCEEPQKGAKALPEAQLWEGTALPYRTLKTNLLLGNYQVLANKFPKKPDCLLQEGASYRNNLTVANNKHLLIVFSYGCTKVG